MSVVRNLLPRGLRARSVVAFLLVAAFCTSLSAGFVFHRARAAILEGTQDSTVADLRTQLDSLAGDLPFPPDRAELRSLALELDKVGRPEGWRSSAAYREGDPVSASPSTPPVPQELSEAVQRTGQAAYQRTESQGQAWLNVGMPVAYASDGVLGKPRKLSGLTVYVSLPLASDRQVVAALVSAARTGAAIALILALVPALLAARSVLRPVRRLRSGAERIAGGELSVRLHTEGRDELADLTRSFNTMAEHLQEDDAQRRRMETGARRFAADVAHQLRTPLAAMAPVTDFLAEDAASHVLPPDTAEAVRLVTEGIGVLARMVEDLMEVSRFDARVAPLNAEVLDLQPFVAKTLQIRGWDADGRVNAQVPARLQLCADPRRVDAILANLIENALRHGQPPVTVAAHRSNDHAVITVSDQGPGIPDEVLPHIFERFYRADTARTNIEGSGLGLAIAYENALLHGGSLTATNAPEGGAVFTIVLPLTSASRQEQQCAPAPSF